MKEKTLTSILDERYYALITTKSKQLVELRYNYSGYIGYVNTANRPPGKDPIVVGTFVKNEIYKNENTLLLNRNDIMVLNALFHLYINEERENIEIDLYSIYHKILGQQLKNNNISANYIDIVRSLKKLRDIYIFVGCKSELHQVNTSTSFNKLLDIEVLPKEKALIKFSLGNFGNDIRNRKRYSDIVPIKFLRCKNINKYYIALAICRYIYINKKKKNRIYTFKLETLLKQINYFDRTGNNTGKSYYNLLNQNNISNKTYILNQFIKTSKEILHTLVNEKKIKNYKLVNLEANISILKYSEYIIEIELMPKKYS